MTPIDFHVLPDNEPAARFLYACRLIEKVERLGHNILVVMDTQEEAHELDDLLWSFKPESYIPHQLLGADEDVKVEITHTPAFGKHDDVLVNLSSAIPANVANFKRVIEIVTQDVKVLENTRNHYRIYKQQGHPVTQHKR
jgi:DNA polymerase III subunit chi